MGGHWELLQAQLNYYWSLLNIAKSKFPFQFLAPPFPTAVSFFLSSFTLFSPCLRQLFLVCDICFRVFQHNKIMILLYKLYNRIMIPFFFQLCQSYDSVVVQYLPQHNFDSIVHFFINRSHNEIVILLYIFFLKSNYITEL